MPYEVNMSIDTKGRVTCEVCGSNVQRRGLSRHQSTGLCHALSQVKLTRDLMKERGLVKTDAAQGLLSRAGVPFEIAPTEASRDGRTIRIEVGAYVQQWVRDAWQIVRCRWGGDQNSVLLVLAAMNAHEEYRESVFVAHRMLEQATTSRYELTARRQDLVKHLATQVTLV